MNMIGAKINTKLIESIKNEPIAVGCSGGSDSMALLHYISTVCTNFSVVNFEHGIRGESSVKDSEFVQNYCLNKGIECETIKLNTLDVALELGLTVEESARKLRYEYFNKIINSGKVKYVLLAHHKQDQVETILMRIFRGTGIDGLVGIKEQSGGIIRPFINLDKQDIMQYIKENDIPYVDDETNLDVRYTRNFIRHSILPLVKEKYPKVEDSICRLSEIAEGVDSYFDSLVTVNKIDDNTISIPLLDCKEVFRKSVKRAYLMLGITQDIEYRHYNLIDNLQQLGNGKSLKMPYGTTAYKEYDNIVIVKDKTVADINVLFKLPLDSAILNDKVSIKKVEGDFNVKNGLYFDLDKLPTDCIIRHRKEGDYFTKFGGGTKSLGDYLTDKKVPIRLRDSMLVVAKDSEVYIIIGLAISDKLKINDNSQNIYKITTEKDNGI